MPQPREAATTLHATTGQKNGIGKSNIKPLNDQEKLTIQGLIF